MHNSIHRYFVYILSNTHRTSFYTGVTNDLERRVLQHKVGEGSVFTSKYNITALLYYEDFPDIEQAIAREKQLKNWHRPWKINLIKSQNPLMTDLAIDWFSEEDLTEFKNRKKE